DAAGVQDLHDHLDVGRVEEPEVARVVGQLDARAGTGLSRRLRPIGGDLEPIVVQAKRRRLGAAGQADPCGYRQVQAGQIAVKVTVAAGGRGEVEDFATRHRNGGKVEGLRAAACKGPSGQHL